jgi:hypothetical protein
VRRFSPLLLLLLLSACARLQVGLKKNSVVLDGEASCPVAEDCRAAAERAAVAKAAALYLPPASAASPEVEKAVLGRHADFIKRKRLVDDRAADGRRSVVVRAEVPADALAGALDALGLIKPEGVVGKPKIFISLKESGPGAGTEVGQASDALRRALAARGYSALDYSDRLGPRVQRKGTVEEAREEARRQSADAVLYGTARAVPAQEERLEGFSRWQAAIRATVEIGSNDMPISVDADAVDLSPAAAAAKALENAGMLAGEGLGDALAGRFKERVELALFVVGLDRPEQVQRFLTALRGVPGVVAASPAKLGPEFVVLRVFAERMGAEDLAALLIQLKGFALEIRGVDPAARALDVEVRGI